MTAHDIAPVPPLVASVCEYGIPTVPFGKLDVVIVGVALTVTDEKAVSTVLLPSVARIVNVNDPAELKAPASVQVAPVVPVIHVPLNPVGCVPLSLLHVTVPEKLDAVTV